MRLFQLGAARNTIAGDVDIAGWMIRLGKKRHDLLQFLFQERYYAMLCEWLYDCNFFSCFINVLYNISRQRLITFSSHMSKKKQQI